MAVFKCKMCGGSLEVVEGMTVCECEYCGTQQTLPKNHDEVLTNLFNRANNLRSKSEFDKAQDIYEKIVNQNPTEAEAYWGIILCKYGIEYVEDPATLKKIPTCHRTQLESVKTDADYLAALENADAIQRTVYEREAAEIDRLQKDILVIVHKEKPFDVFICYKETDENGKRTQDSVIANDIYHQLTQEGFKVFYAAITLEDKLGQAYEPYIFAALNSAKVMLVLGTKPEYFNAVWVRNEWSRYLKIVKNDRSKLLIPCYRDMDAYDLPDDFSHLQAQDMSKIGFINDVIRGIKKIVQKEPGRPVVQQTTVVQTAASTNVENILKRGNLALEDGKWDEANRFFEHVLDEDVEEHRAYIGMLCAEMKVQNEVQLLRVDRNFTQSDHFRKACRFGGDAVKKRLSGYRLQGQYDRALQMLNTANDAEQCDRARTLFTTLGDFSDSVQKAEESRQKALKIRYDSAVGMMSSADNETAFSNAAARFDALGDYQDAAQKAAVCREKALKLRYDRAVGMMNRAENEDDFKKAAARFDELGDYQDAAQKAAACRKSAEECRQKALQIRYDDAVSMMNGADNESAFSNAAARFDALGDYQDAAQKAAACRKKADECCMERIYSSAVWMMNKDTESELESAAKRFSDIPDYKDAAELRRQCKDKIEALQAARKAEHERQEQAHIAAEAESKRKAKKKKLIAIISETVVVLTVAWIATFKIVHSFKIKKAIKEVSQSTISAGIGTAIGLKSDGTVVATGWNLHGELDITDWKDIAAVSVCSTHTIGLKSDGTVVATGDYGQGQCNVSEWKDIVAVSAGRRFTIGLKYDGTVVATGFNEQGQCDVSEWKDTVAVSAGWDHTAGLKSDGTVVATGNNEQGQCNVSEWKNIVAVSAGDSHTIGLKSDGTVVATGYNEQGQCNVSEWKNIVAVSAGSLNTFGLKSDGTVVATGDNEQGQCNVSEWKNIVAVSANYDYTIGLKSDGTVVAAGYNGNGQCDVSGWKNIKIPE